MKNVKLVGILIAGILGFSTLGQADVNIYHAKNALKGTYKLKVSKDEAYKIKISGKDNVDVTGIGKSNKGENYLGTVTWNYEGNDDGPNGLPVAVILISQMSDEDISTSQIRITFEQSGFGDSEKERKAAELVFLDMIDTFNDGPGSSSTVTRVNKAKLSKMIKNGKNNRYRKIRKL